MLKSRAIHSYISEPYRRSYQSYCGGKSSWFLGDHISSEERDTFLIHWTHVNNEESEADEEVTITIETSIDG